MFLFVKTVLIMIIKAKVLELWDLTLIHKKRVLVSRSGVWFCEAFLHILDLDPGLLSRTGYRQYPPLLLIH